MAINPIGRIRVNVTGARGAIGLDLIGSPQPGQFVVFNADRKVQGSAGTGADSGLRSDLAAKNGSALNGYIGSNPNALQRSVQAKLRETVSVIDFRFVADVDDTAAFERASNAAKSVLVPAGMGRGSDGRYIVNDALIASNTRINGDGPSSVVSPPTGIVAGAGPASRATFRVESGLNIGFSNLTLDGRVTAEGFSEHCHLIAVYGVFGFNAERVTFLGFRGDGLIFEGQPRTFTGSSTEARHNIDLTVRDCTFDGVNNNNRNGISVVDGVNVLFESNTFRRCTKSGNVSVDLDPMNPNTGIPMPGAIDFEPNPYSFYVLQNIRVRGNTFDNCGGNFGAVGFFIPTEVTFVPSDIQISFNNFRNSVQSSTGADILINMNRDLGATVMSQGIVIEGNTGFNGRSPFFVRSAKGVVISASNRWEQYTFSATIGYLSTNERVYSTVVEPVLVRCGMSAPSQFGVAVFSVSDLDFGRAQFIDCGDGSPNASAIALLTGGSSKITMNGLRVTSPTGKTKRAVFSDGHTQNPETNRMALADFGGFPSAFSAMAPGQIINGSFAWTPGPVTRVNSALATFTVVGAVKGDVVSWSYSEELDLTQFMVCRVRDTNTILVGIYTTADASITPPAGTVTVKVTKQ